MEDHPGQAGGAVIIRLSRYSGYCFGVKRAVTLALNAQKENGEVYTVGELIHNPATVQGLEAKGIKVAKDPTNLRNQTVIIRSHGIPKADLEQLEANNNAIIDATCPYVKRTHEIIRNMVEEGYPVWIMGDIDHPEVQGMLSYGNAKTKVIAPESKPDVIPSNRLCLIAQTTKKLKNLEELACELLPKLVELRVFNTICLATSQRQEEAIKLARQSDVMIVVGGHSSSNTRSLAALCAHYCPAYHIETEAELPDLESREDLRIGIAGGASTPDDAIVKVYNRIKDKSGDSHYATSIADIPLFKEES